MKIKLSILLPLVLIFCFPCLANAQKSIEIYENKAVTEKGEVSFKSLPFLYTTDKEYLYIPIEDVLPAMGANLGWDSQRNAEICIYNGKTYYLYSNRNEVEYNGEFLWFDAPSLIKDNRFYINDEVFKYITGDVLTSEAEIQEYGVLTVVANDRKAFLNGKETKLETTPYTYLSKTHIPLDSAFGACGYSLGWDAETNAVICYKDGIYSYVYTTEGKIIADGKEYSFDYTPVYISNVMYISDEMFRTVTGFDVVPYGTLKSYKGRDTLRDTTRTDAYRLSGSSVVRGGGVTVVNGFGMELVSFSDSDAVKYAGVISAVAETLSDDIDVYNILVPTSAEFYAPLSMYPNQLHGIRTVYENLSDRVIPVNVYDTLKNHANEKIYFGTDHHWTQRGAYYAYKEFIEHKGGTIDDLSTFNNVPSYNHVGSFAGFARGTAAGNIMKSSPELLERFMPKYATVGTVFSDCAVTRPQYTVKAVNTSNNAYSCFVGGDAPVTVFYTDAPSDESVVIIKESFGNAFATWALHNYKKVCIVDPRKFNGFGGNYANFNLKSFCEKMEIDDVVFINYPVVVASSGIRGAILSMK